MNSASYSEGGLPDRIESVEHLDQLLTRPSSRLVDFVANLEGPLVILGAGGKMGPTLVVRALCASRAAGSNLEVIAVSRFTDQTAADWLRAQGATVVSCDMLNRDEVMRLPDAPNVIYLVGRKFGTTNDPARTWAMNIFPAEYAVERYHSSRIVALSSGNVYPPVPAASGGSIESDPLVPVGEYANACVARERVFEYCSSLHSTPVCLIRLNYAVEMRYGVLVDIARSVWIGDPVPVSVGYLNCIWQGDANDIVIRALSSATPGGRALNLTGRDVLSVRSIAHRFGELMNRTVRFDGTESGTALLSNPAAASRLFAPPSTPIDKVIEWTADWIMNDRPTLGKPTGFERNNGAY